MTPPRIFPMLFARFHVSTPKKLFNYISLLQPVKVQLHYFGRKKYTIWYNGPYKKKTEKQKN